MDCSTAGFPVLHYLPEFVQTHLLIQWHYLTLSSFASPFSICLQSFPISGSFPVSQLFAPGVHSIGDSVSASVLPMNIQSWFPLGLTGLISLQSKGLFFIYILFFFIFKLYKIVLVLPNIKMNPPQVYMCSPSWTLLPPPSPYHPSGSSQCISPKHPISCIEPGLATRFIHDILRVFSNTTIQKHQFFGAQPFLWSNCHIPIWLLEKP